MKITLELELEQIISNGIGLCENCIFTAEHRITPCQAIQELDDIPCTDINKNNLIWVVKKVVRYEKGE